MRRSGYLNVRRIENGREVRTIEVDPERGPLMTWAFEAYATGDWTIRRLLAELTDRGLTTAPGAQDAGQTAQRLASAHTAAAPVLHGPGALSRCALSRASTTPLVTPETWHRGPRAAYRQELRGREAPRAPALPQGLDLLRPLRLPPDRQLRQRTTAAPIPISSASVANSDKHELHAAGHPHRGCSRQPSPPTTRRSSSRRQEVARLRAFLGEELAKLRTRRRAGTHGAGLGGSSKLEGERKKLLDAHYADAMPLDLLKTEARPASPPRYRHRRPPGARSRPTSRQAEANLQPSSRRVGDCERRLPRSIWHRAPAVQPGVLQAATH